MITVAFTGHRPKQLPGGGNYYSDENIALNNVLRKVIFRLYKRLSSKYGEDIDFTGGGASGFDTFALAAAMELQRVEPDHVSLTMAIPFRHFDSNRQGTWLSMHDTIKSACNSIVYVDELDSYKVGVVEPGMYDTRKYILRDRYMVDKCDILVCAMCGKHSLRSGTRATYMYAKTNKDIILLDLSNHRISFESVGSKYSEDIKSIVVELGKEGIWDVETFI